MDAVCVLTVVSFFMGPLEAYLFAPTQLGHIYFLNIFKPFWNVRKNASSAGVGN